MKQRLTLFFLLLSVLAGLTFSQFERGADAAARRAASPLACPGGNILYVNAAVVGGAGDGSSWANAYSSLAAALAANCPNVTQIWVAQGTYKPTSVADRNASFTLRNNLAIYGGFTTGQFSLDERNPNPATNGTVLSGDLNGDDGANFANNDENSYHVISCDGTNHTAILDGFTIKGGWANGAEPNNRGGGMYNENSRPLLTNLSFSGNKGLNGGGMYNIYSDPKLTNVSFIGNSASNHGGGMYNENSRPTLTNATFIGNSASNRGGGVYNETFGSPTLINVSFSGNSSTAGGGIFNNNQSYPAIRNSILWGDSGGEIVNDFSNPSVSSSTVQGGYPGNFAIDPQFISPSNLRLQATSRSSTLVRPTFRSRPPIWTAIRVC